MTSTLNTPSTGMLVAIVGADGVGKTTLVGNLAARHPEHDNLVLTREPYDRERIKPLFDAGEVSEQTFTSDRRQHWREVIGPGIDRNSIVITDRYWMCTAVYQAAGAEEKAQAKLDEIFQHQRDLFGEPHVVVHLTLDPIARCERLTQRGDEREIERSNRVARLYDVALQKLERSVVCHVNAAEPPETVCNRVVALLNLTMSLSREAWLKRGVDPYQHQKWS